MDIISQVKKTIQNHKLIHQGDRLILGVSGGADSIFLLHVLYQLRYELGCEIQVAHINHGLRKTSAHDQKFVQKSCQQFKIPFHTTTLKRKKSPGSTEDWARDNRLKFFRRVCQKQKADALVLGHTQDDLAETVLMKILRGSGLMGARGILPKRVLHGVTVIRPLLEIRRKDLELFLKQNQFTYCHDPTNDTLNFYRNKIRLELLPFLEKKFNPNIKTNLAQLSKILIQDYDFLELETRKNLKMLKCESTNTISLPLVPFQKLHPSQRRMLLRSALENLRGNTNQLNFVHLKEIDELIHQRPVSSVVDLPDGIFALKTRQKLVLSKKKSLIKSLVQL